MVALGAVKKHRSGSLHRFAKNGYLGGSFETWRETPSREATASPHVQVTPCLHFGFSPPEYGGSNAGNCKGRNPSSMDLLMFNPIWSVLHEDLTLPLLFTPTT